VSFRFQNVFDRIHLSHMFAQVSIGLVGVLTQLCLDIHVQRALAMEYHGFHFISSAVLHLIFTFAVQNLWNLFNVADVSMWTKSLSFSFLFVLELAEPREVPK